MIIQSGQELKYKMTLWLLELSQIQDQSKNKEDQDVFLLKKKSLMIKINLPTNDTFDWYYYVNQLSAKHSKHNPLYEGPLTRRRR